MRSPISPTAATGCCSPPTGNSAAAVAAAVRIEPGRDGGAVELLLLLGIAVGVLRADGLRVRAAARAWRALDDTLRAGLVFAAWCQHAAFLRCGACHRP
jgi:hypothetical protein